MAASPPTATVPSAPKTEGGNVLAALLAAAAASMHRQQQQQQQQLLLQQQQQTQQANVCNSEVHLNNHHNHYNNHSHHNHNNNHLNNSQSQQRLPQQQQQQNPNKNGAGSNINKFSRNNNKTTSSYKSSTSSSSSNSTSIDNDSSNAAKLLASLANGTYRATETPVVATNITVAAAAAETSHVELRNLETWHDEDEKPMDESCYQELEFDPSNSNGWSADDMFKYNEKMHKIFSTYNERTLVDNYTTPLPKMNSKNTMRLATQLAKEIEDRVMAEGRITPESSDDDELFEAQRMRRIQLKQQKQLDQLKNLQRNQLQNRQILTNQPAPLLLMNSVATSKSKTNTTKSSTSHYSTETPATASLSSSPTLNDIIKPVTSSSRNILRTCLT